MEGGIWPTLKFWHGAPYGLGRLESRKAKPQSGPVEYSKGIRRVVNLLQKSSNVTLGYGLIYAT